MVILILIIVALMFFFQQGRKNILTDPYKAIPVDASLVFESVDLPAFMNLITGESSLFRELSMVKELDRFNRKISYFSGLINREEYSRFFETHTALISFHLNEKGKLLPLLVTSVPSEFRYRNFKGVLLSTVKGTLTERKKRGSKVICIKYPFLSGADSVFISYNSGLLICSPSEELLMSAVSQNRIDGDIRMLPGFSKVMAASGKKVDKIFLVFDNISQIFRTSSNAKTRGFEKIISGLAGSAEGDIYLNDGDLLLSGFMECADSTDLLYKSKSNPSGSLDTYRVLPAITILFETKILDGRVAGIKNRSSKADSTAKLASLLTGYLGDEITRAYLNMKEDTGNVKALIIYELKNREAAETLFTEYLKVCSGSDTGDENKSVTWFQPDDQTRIPVYSTPFKGLVSFFVPGFEGDTAGSLFAFYDNYMISGDSYSAVTRLLYDNMLQKTLANDLIYRDFEGTMPGRAGYFFYCVPSEILSYFSEFLGDTLLNALNSNINSIKKIQAAGFQYSASNGMIYHTLSVKYKNEIREEAGTEWETLLDTAACIKPFFFTNHITGAKEIFIQDYNNNAYLVNAAGRVMWKVRLGERIVSNVFMIDYYGNGKYQLLFSGRNNLHILDRNGNYVERYPLRLRSPASGPVALFDYDSNLDYRLIIPGEDKLIYAYDKSGNVVKGWNAFKTNGIVSAEIKFFRVSGKDYLVASDETTVYFLDRTGKVRLRLKEPATRAKGSEIRITTGQEPSLIFSSPDGTLQMVSFDGIVRKTTLRRFSGDHSFDFFDIDGDGFGEYLFIDRGILYLYDQDKSEIFSRDFGSVNINGPISFIFSGTDRKTGVFDSEKKLIYLIDKNGKTMDGFPLRGASMFSIGKFAEKSNFHLIVGGENSFLYNYRLNSTPR